MATSGFEISLAHRTTEMPEQTSSFDLCMQHGDKPINDKQKYKPIVTCKNLGRNESYYQRVLACSSVRAASVSSILGAFAALLLALPPYVIGVVGAAADWNQTSYQGEVPLPKSKRSLIMPLVLQYLCPEPVSIIGIGAVAAAVMSSADSCVLSSASVFTKNIYIDIIRPKASDREMVWVLRVSILMTGIVATSIAIVVNSVYGLLVISSDLMYVIMFPQLTCVLWFHGSNGYGCLSGYAVGLILRLMGGESILHFSAAVHFPMYDPEVGQLFPFRTLAMLSCLLTIVGVSQLTDAVFTRGWLPARYDILHCMRHRTIERKEDKGELDLMMADHTVMEASIKGQVQSRCFPVVKNDEDAMKI